MILTELLNHIRQANDAELTTIVQMVIARYGELFPDDEIIFVSLPKNAPDERRETIKQILRMTAMEFPSGFGHTTISRT